MADPSKFLEISDEEDDTTELDHAQKDRLQYLMSKVKPEDLQDSCEEAEDDKPTTEKKKKKSRRPKSKRGKSKPTGFENFYVDSPLTPEDHEVERKLYDLSRPVTMRLEDALVRYTVKRRIESDRKNVFDKYLVYGGVDVGPRMFGGVDERELAEMTKDQKLAARAQTSIPYSRSNFEIDFDLVVKGFLTSFFIEYFTPDSEDMVKLGTVTIKNFLNYLHYHDVCPEYNNNINAARKSCDVAQKDLWNNHCFLKQGPGDFNKACSHLFGGFYFELRCEISVEHEQVDGKGSVEDGEESTKDETPEYSLLSDNDARKIVKFALAGAGTDEKAFSFHELVMENKLEASRVEDIDGFEVIDFNLPEEDLRAFYRHHVPELKSVGIMRAKAYKDPAKSKVDLYPDERALWENSDTWAQIHFEFFIEEDLLKFCYPGMKVITSVWRLNCGVDYFDNIRSVYSSIYTVLPNDLMMGWKEPRPILSALEKEERDKLLRAAGEQEEHDQGYQEHEDIDIDID